MKIYFANALFSHADFDYNAKLAAQIRTAIPKVDLYVLKKMRPSTIKKRTQTPR